MNSCRYVKDFECKYGLNEANLIFTPSNDSFIGGGAFGNVYLASYNGDEVAVKSFGSNIDAKSHSALRRVSKKELLSKIKCLIGS